MIGDGSWVKFWKDACCSGEPLCVLFPYLYAVVGSKGASVKEVWMASGAEGGVEPLF